MNTDSKDGQPNVVQQRLEALERRTKLLVSLGIGQVCLLVAILSLILMNQFMPKWSSLLMFAVIAGMVAYIFRRQLPGIMGRCSRYVFSKMSKSQKDGSRKDIN